MGPIDFEEIFTNLPREWPWFDRIKIVTVKALRNVEEDSQGQPVPRGTKLALTILESQKVADINLLMGKCLVIPAKVL